MRSIATTTTTTTTTISNSDNDDAAMVSCNGEKRLRFNIPGINCQSQWARDCAIRQDYQHHHDCNDEVHTTAGYQRSCSMDVSSRSSRSAPAELERSNHTDKERTRKHRSIINAGRRSRSTDDLDVLKKENARRKKKSNSNSNSKSRSKKDQKQRQKHNKSEKKKGKKTNKKREHLSREGTQIAVDDYLSKSTRVRDHYKFDGVTIEVASDLLAAMELLKRAKRTAESIKNESEIDDILSMLG